MEHVTKIGNIVPGGQDSPPPILSDYEMDKEKPVDSASRKSSRPGKRINPRLDRNDWEVKIPKKKRPRSPSRGCTSCPTTEQKSHRSRKKMVTVPESPSLAPETQKAAEDNNSLRE